MGDGGAPIDLNDLVAKRKLDLALSTPESPEEIRSRIKTQEDAAAHQRRVFWAVFAILSLISGVCFGIVLGVLAPNASAQTHEWARGILTAVAGGVVGYLGGAMGRAP